MIKKYILTVIVCLCAVCGFAQTVEDGVAAQPQTIETLLQEAYASMQETHDVFTNVSDRKPWQVALFLSAHPYCTLQPLLKQIETQIHTGNIAMAVLVHNASETANAEGVIYILYSQAGHVRQEKRMIDASIQPLVLWKTLLKHFNQHPNFHTGIVAQAHAHDTAFHYPGGYLTAQEIIQALANSHLHVDFMELQSCHASSLYNLYHLTRNSRIDYLVASANFSFVSLDDVSNVLRFLNTSPSQVAVLSVQERLKNFRVGPTHPTGGAGALNLKALRNPLQKYIRLYQDLLSYEYEENIESDFDSFFNSALELKGLDEVILKQREYIRAHMADTRFKALYQTQQQFLKACDALLSALTHATLQQWCYSKQAHQIYRGVPPAYSDCLGSVNVSLDQYNSL